MKRIISALLTLSIIMTLCAFSFASVSAVENDVTASGEGLKYQIEADGTATVVDHVKNDEYYIEIPEYYKGHRVARIGERAFANKFYISSVTIPNTVKEIGREAFAVCIHLKSINIPKSVVTVENNAFANSCIETAVLEDGITAVPDYMFSGCESLISVQIPETVREIGYWSFANCKNLKLEVLPPYLEKLSQYSFTSCAKMGPELVIPKTFKESNINAFMSTGIKKIVFEDGIEVIPEYALSGADMLEEIVIPDSVKLINNSAFTGCDMLKDVYIPASVTEYSKMGIFTVNADLCIWGYADTATEQYAANNNIKIVAIDKNMGDVNLDGGLSIIDATEIQKNIVELSYFPEGLRKMADVNGDGTVSIIDAAFIQKQILQ